MTLSDSAKYSMTRTATAELLVRMCIDTGTSSDNSSVPGRQVSSAEDDYRYDYEYESSLDDEMMFDVEPLDIEYVDDLALADDDLDPALEFGLDATRHETSRRRRPHTRYVTILYSLLL